MTSKAAVRQRGAGFPQASSTTRPGDVYLHKDDKRRSTLSGAALLPDTFVLLYLLLVAFLIAIALHSYWRLPNPISHGEPNEFIAGNARKHLEDIASLGIRHVGNPANEIHAKNMIVQKVEEVRATASKNVEIEISLQYPSGHYFLDFLGGMTHLYHNVTNIVVRFSRKGTAPEHAFLINAHFDSALGTVAASDDIVSCATMLEVLRSLSAEPHPLLAEHALIFLFNGAEETILQASHGFIMQHPWAKQIRAFLNLEAAGAGGKEIVFQTGPHHPWLVRTYTKVVPHPFATILAQEIFQSGIIPSDTDFRIFRDYGHIPGIDVAYFVNGYVYHTEYDVPSRIPDSCIQRAGENVLALLKEIANSPFLADPGDDKHGKVVFFDIMGLTAVTFPERIAIIFNVVVAIAAIVSVYFGVSRQGDTGQMKQDTPSLTKVLSTLGTLLLSWIAALASAVVTALFLGQCSCLMTWFTHNIIILPLYGAPAFLAMAGVHIYHIYKNPEASQKALEKSCFYAVQLLWTILLVVFTYLRVCSAFVFAVWAVFPLVFRVLIWETLAQKNIDKKQQPVLYYTMFVILSALSLSLPFIFGSLMAVGIFDMFIPLMGRSGSLFSPDLPIAILTAVMVCFQATSMLSVVIYSSSLKLKRWVGSLLLLVYVVALLLALSGYMFPYSGGEQPRAKRLYLQHTERTFYNADGTVKRADSQVFLNSFDFLGIDVIANEVPMLKKAMVAECEGVYCGQPFYIPVKHLIKTSWYLPAPKLQMNEPLSLKLLSRERASSGVTNFTFQAKFPTRVSMYISPKRGHSMTAWSLEKFVPPSTPCVLDQECYFVFYARGQGDGEHTFWVELKPQGDPEKTVGESMEIAVATHHLDPPTSQTEFLSGLLQSLPDWVTAVAWTCTYTSWVF